MLDLGWTELLVIGLLALLVVGPKELPGMLRTIGQYVGKAKSMAREFQRSMEDAAREADLGDLTQLRDAKKELDNLARVDFSEQAKRTQSSLMNPKPVETANEGATKSVSAEDENVGSDVVDPEPAPKAQGDKA